MLSFDSIFKELSSIWSHKWNGSEPSLKPTLDRVPLNLEQPSPAVEVPPPGGTAGAIPVGGVDAQVISSPEAASPRPPNPSGFKPGVWLRNRLTILVEEEECLRRSWEVYFQSQGKKLLTYGSAEEFIADFRPTGEALDFFFDQDFGNVRGVGVRLAAYVEAWPDRVLTSLVTAYPAEYFEAELASGLVNQVHDKFPVRLFGHGYFATHMQRRYREEGKATVYKKAAKTLVDTLDHYNSEMLRLENSRVRMRADAKI